MGCWQLADLFTEIVMRAGAVAKFNKSKCGRLKTHLSAEPGEVVIVIENLP
jgi:hypothetical protein